MRKLPIACPDNEGFKVSLAVPGISIASIFPNKPLETEAENPFMDDTDEAAARCCMIKPTPTTNTRTMDARDSKAKVRPATSSCLSRKLLLPIFSVIIIRFICAVPPGKMMEWFARN